MNDTKSEKWDGHLVCVDCDRILSSFEVAKIWGTPHEKISAICTPCMKKEIKKANVIL
jgi:hypothetical protein